MKNLCTHFAKALFVFSVSAFQLFSFSARAASQFDAYLWVTNTAQHSNSLTFNSLDVRYAVTNVTNSATQWAVTNTAAWTASNLLSHLDANRPLGVSGYSVQRSATNAAVLIISAPGSSNLTVVPVGSGGSNWAWVRYVTNTYATSTNVVVPPGTYSLTAQSNVAAGIIDWLNLTNRNDKRVDNHAPAFANFLSTRTNGQNGTNITLRLSTIDGGTVTNSALKLVSIRSVAGTTTYTNTGIAFTDTNGTIVAILTAATDGRPWLVKPDGTAWTNANNSAALITYGSGHNVFGKVINDDPTEHETNFWETVQQFTNLLYATQARLTSPTISNATMQGYWEKSGTIYIDDQQIGIFTGTIIASEDGKSFNFNGPTEGMDTNSIVTRADFNATQFAGSSDQYNAMSIRHGAPVTNAQLRLVSTNWGALLNRSVTITTLATNNNVMERSTNNFLILSSTAGAANINAITNGFGDGDWFEAVNNTGYPLTLVHESGFTSIAANRLQLCCGVSSLVISNGARFKLVYQSGGVDRWTVAWPMPPSVLTASLTNGFYRLSSNSVEVSSTATNLNFVPGSGVSVTFTNNTNSVDIGISATAGSTGILTNGGSGTNNVFTAPILIRPQSTNSLLVNATNGGDFALLAHITYDSGSLSAMWRTGYFRNLLVTNLNVMAGITNTGGASFASGNASITSAGAGTFAGLTLNGGVTASIAGGYAFSGGGGFASTTTDDFNIFGSGFNFLGALHLGVRNSNSVAITLSNTPPVVYIRDGTRSNAIPLEVGASMGRTNAPFVVRSGSFPSATMVMQVSTNGDIYTVGDVSAATITDRSDAPPGRNKEEITSNAWASVMSVTAKDGKLDHSKLHPHAWGKSVRYDKTGKWLTNVVAAYTNFGTGGIQNVVPRQTNIVEETIAVEFADQSKRNVSRMVSDLAIANQDLRERVEDLEDKFTQLLTALVAAGVLGGGAAGALGLKKKKGAA